MLEKDTAKKEAKAEAKALAEAKKKEVRRLLPSCFSMGPELFVGVDGHDQTDTTEQEQVRDGLDSRFSSSTTTAPLFLTSTISNFPTLLRRRGPRFLAIASHRGAKALLNQT